MAPIRKEKHRGKQSERGAAETAEAAGDLGDGGGGGGQDGGGSVTTEYVMKDGQDGIEQPAACRAASASATSLAHSGGLIRGGDLQRGVSVAGSPCISSLIENLRPLLACNPP